MIDKHIIFYCKYIMQQMIQRLQPSMSCPMKQGFSPRVKFRPSLTRYGL